jgi:hypothetical protein
LVIHVIAPLHVQNVFGTVHHSKYLIVVDETNLTPVDWYARASVAAKNNPITLFAPGTSGKFRLIGVG